MRFALVGDHLDGVSLSTALAATSRFTFAAYCGPQFSTPLGRFSPARTTTDLEDILADPEIQMVIVAGPLGVRGQQLRRVLQSERAALCVQPVDRSPDLVYEAALIQGDTKQLLLPILPEGLHPGLKKFAVLVDQSRDRVNGNLVIEWQRSSRGEVVVGSNETKFTVPDWTGLRTAAGEIAEVVSLSLENAMSDGTPIVLSGRFEKGGMFHAALLPKQANAAARLTLTNAHLHAVLEYSDDWRGDAKLRWTCSDGTTHEETWSDWNSWTAFAKMVEQEFTADSGSAPKERAELTWQDAIRNAELDEAARRSLTYRRVNVMEYPEATEEVGFKGAMTLIGCVALIVLPLVVLVAASVVPKYSWWIVLPGLGVFLLLQALRWVLPASPDKER